MRFHLPRKTLTLALTLLAILSLSACASAQDYSRYDLSTVDGVNAAREAKLGRRLDSYSKGCVKIPEQLRGIVLIGSFAFDRGCALQEAIINKQGVQKGKQLSAVALDSLGWKYAKGEKRREVALNWVQLGLLAFESPLTSATKDFKPGTFQPPQVDLNEDGSVSVSVWVQRPSGMQCEAVYDKIKFIFLVDGTLSSETTENSFRVPCGLSH